MTLPEHAVCSLLLAQFGARQSLGTSGVVLVVAAGMSPDVDSAVKLFSDAQFWQLHHALGHSLLFVVLLAMAVAAVGRWAFDIRPFWLLCTWCLAAAVVHCATDALYWWGIQPLWPFSPLVIRLDILEYLDLFVLALWLSAAVCMYKLGNSRRVAAVTFSLFVGYVALRAALPPPTGIWKFLAGGWMYEAPQGTPVLDWW